jgi:hypothetical protein
VSILGFSDFIEPLMKYQKLFLKPLNRDQLPAYAGEPFCLEASYPKLPNEEPVPA